jgi:hypothetical protein
LFLIYISLQKVVCDGPDDLAEDNAVRILQQAGNNVRLQLGMDIDAANVPELFRAINRILNQNSPRLGYRLLEFVGHEEEGHYIFHTRTVMEEEDSVILDLALFANANGLEGHYVPAVETHPLGVPDGQGHPLDWWQERQNPPDMHEMLDVTAIEEFLWPVDAESGSATSQEVINELICDFIGEESAQFQNLEHMLQKLKDSIDILIGHPFLKAPLFIRRLKADLDVWESSFYDFKSKVCDFKNEEEEIDDREKFDDWREVTSSEFRLLSASFSKISVEFDEFMSKQDEFRRSVVEHRRQQQELINKQIADLQVLHGNDVVEDNEIPRGEMPRRYAEILEEYRRVNWDFHLTFLAARPGTQAQGGSYVQ